MEKHYYKIGYNKHVHPARVDSPKYAYLRFWADSGEDALNQFWSLRDRTFDTGINPMRRGCKTIYIGMIHASDIEQLPPGK